MNNFAHNFFKKRGYNHSWGDCGCFDMSQMLDDFDYNEHSIGDMINEITYRWATLDDLDGIVECVSDSMQSFMQHYQDKYLYRKDTNMPVLIAEKDNEVLGTLIVCIETKDKNMGSVSCTATRHKQRNKGIATTMVILGTKYLEDIGLTKACLGYTYTDIITCYTIHKVITRKVSIP